MRVSRPWAASCRTSRSSGAAPRSSRSRRYGVAVAKALAQPPVAAEWCLPLVRPGAPRSSGWAEAEADSVAAVAERLGASLEAAPPGFMLLRKTGPTPPGFPRRAGVAKKRPLA